MARKSVDVTRGEARASEIGLRPADGDGINLYYGAADTSVALAKGSIGQLPSWLDRHGSE